MIPSPRLSRAPRSYFINPNPEQPQSPLTNSQHQLEHLDPNRHLTITIYPPNDHDFLEQWGCQPLTKAMFKNAVSVMFFATAGIIIISIWQFYFYQLTNKK